MKIKRTQYANQSRSTVWVSDPLGEFGALPMSDTAHVNEYPTHSCVLGPDGLHLQYEEKKPIGFDLSKGRK